VASTPRPVAACAPMLFPRRASPRPREVVDRATWRAQLPGSSPRDPPVVAEVQGRVARTQVPGRVVRHEPPVHPDRDSAGGDHVGGVGPARATRGPRGVARSRRADPVRTGGAHRPRELRPRASAELPAHLVAPHLRGDPLQRLRLGDPPGARRGLASGLGLRREHVDPDLRVHPQPTAVALLGC
jgi:hypothetical protein